jgi:hypothetical protein
MWREESRNACLKGGISCLILSDDPQFAVRWIDARDIAAALEHFMLRVSAPAGEVATVRRDFPFS